MSIASASVSTCRRERTIASSIARSKSRGTAFRRAPPAADRGRAPARDRTARPPRTAIALPRAWRSSRPAPAPARRPPGHRRAAAIAPSCWPRSSRSRRRSPGTARPVSRVGLPAGATASSAGPRPEVQLLLRRRVQEPEVVHDDERRVHAEPLEIAMPLHGPHDHHRRGRPHHAQRQAPERPGDRRISREGLGDGHRLGRVPGGEPPEMKLRACPRRGAARNEGYRAVSDPATASRGRQRSVGLRAARASSSRPRRVTDGASCSASGFSSASFAIACMASTN